jgi:hypothetical protein
MVNTPAKITESEIAHSSHAILTEAKPRIAPNAMPNIKARGPIQIFFRQQTLQKPTKKMTSKWSIPLKGCIKPDIKLG